jgi:LEA14-like dessication related protein
MNKKILILLLIGFVVSLYYSSLFNIEYEIVNYSVINIERESITINFLIKIKNNNFYPIYINKITSNLYLNKKLVSFSRFKIGLLYPNLWEFRSIVFSINNKYLDEEINNIKLQKGIYFKLTSESYLFFFRIPFYAEKQF